MTPSGSMELLYANQFFVDYYDGGRALISVADGEKYLVVPENGRLPEELPKDITVIRRPADRIYLAATSAMDLFCSLDALDRITFSGTDLDGWYIDEARKAMEEGRLAYAGKYNAPDYERILSGGCGLAIESTMIYHSPEVKEQLERLGIPVFVERSSYESHPLGRMEWIKLYGVLTGKEAEAERIFKERAKPLLDAGGLAPTGKTVAFFSVNSRGSVTVRKPGDYISRLIGMAGGVYVPGDLPGGENALSTVNLQMESFYAAAKDADVLIYNSAIDGGLSTKKELLAKSSLFQDFRAVKNGEVWCTGKNLFQETMGLADLAEDVRRILTEQKPEGLHYLKRLE